MKGFAQAWLLSTVPELRDIMGKQASREDSELETFAAEAITDLIRFQKCLSREKMGDKDFLICLDICQLHACNGLNPCPPSTLCKAPV